MADSTDVELVSSVRDKFEKLENVCMDRYMTREKRVLSVVQYCMSTLEQLQGWAGYAIFPVDERHSDRYMEFVEHRLRCVICPMRGFYRVLKPTGGAALLSGPITARSEEGAAVELSGSLRDRTAQMCALYRDEAEAIRAAVQQRVTRCRKDMRAVFRWGQGSLMDLQDVLDDAMADELYFMVRGRMARILSTTSSYEDICDGIERSLAQVVQPQDRACAEADDVPVRDCDVTKTPREAASPALRRAASDVSDLKGRGSRVPPTPGALTREAPLTRRSVESEALMTTVDLSLDLHDIPEEDLGAAYLGSASDSAVYVDEESTKGSGSTPTPPTSPRPRSLLSHPKIVKDKLNKFALPALPGSRSMGSGWL